MHSIKHHIIAVACSFALISMILLFSTPNLVHADFILDNDQPGTSQSGRWGRSSAPDSYGSNSRASIVAGATYSYSADLSGDYEVHIWWTSKTGRCRNVPVDIQDSGGGIGREYVDQSTGGGQWTYLGTFTFDGLSRVTIHSEAIDGCHTCADAVQWIQLPADNDPPTASIDSIAPNPADDEELIRFSGHGDDPARPIIGYRWRSSVDGMLSYSSSFTTSTLSVGDHTIFFEVQNDEGVWSAPAREELTINMIANEVFPGERWKTATPDSQGVDAAVLQQAISNFDLNAGGVGTDEMVIIRNGYMIWKGTASENPHALYSATKTFTTTILGLLLQDGAIPTLAAEVVDHYPSLDDVHADYQAMTFQQLASMTSGYDGINGDCWQLYQQGAYTEYDACILTFTDPGPPLFVPGTAFKYHDPAVHLLGYVMTHISGSSLEEIFMARIGEEIGMRSFAWTNYGATDELGGLIFNNPAGTPGTNQGGIITAAEDVARFGLLYLKRGSWNGRQLLLQQWVDEATRNQVPVELDQYSSSFDHRGSYGYMWYTNDIGVSGSRRWPSAPPKAFTSIGVSRNFCFIIPEWNMVIVRLSPYATSSMTDFGDPVWEAFFNQLQGGVQ
jgi:CubicO group peptidase (beta-lactamase class C family)